MSVFFFHLHIQQIHFFSLGANLKEALYGCMLGVENQQLALQKKVSLCRT